MTIFRSGRLKASSGYCLGLVLVVFSAIAGCGSSGSASQAPNARSIPGKLNTASSSANQAPNARSTQEVIAGAAGQGVSPPPQAGTSPQPITSPADSASATDLTSDEQFILSQLTSRVFTWCNRYPAAENSDIVAALSCVPFQSGPTGNVGVYAYADFGALQQAMASLATDVTNNNDCGSGAYVGSWNHDGVYEGSKVCLLLSDGSVEIHWSFRALPIMVVARGDSGLYGIDSWWSNNAYCIKQ